MPFQNQKGSRPDGVYQTGALAAAPLGAFQERQATVADLRDRYGVRGVAGEHPVTLVAIGLAQQQIEAGIDPK